jgi:hypothetical protein
VTPELSQYQLSMEQRENIHGMNQRNNTHFIFTSASNSGIRVEKILKDFLCFGNRHFFLANIAQSSKLSIWTRP